MKYITTKNKKKKYGFEEIITKGKTSKEGLIIPERIPKINRKKIRKISCKKKFYILAQYIIKKFCRKKEFKKLNIKKSIKRIFKNKEKFIKKKFFKIKKIRKKNIYILNLNFGKTLSFKDIAISLISEIIKRTNKKINIITATSGDTGSSCVKYARGKKIKNIIIYPHKKISRFQEAQICGYKEENIMCLSIKGNFDKCQNITKRNILKKNITTLNSINFLRIIIQSIYYIKYFFIINKKDRKKDIVFRIPTGNFGNAFSAFLAYKMGTPIKKIVISNNENNTSYKIIKGQKNNKKKITRTNCPSMDILIPSNIERYTYYHKKKNIKEKNIIAATYSKKKEREKLIKEIMEKYNIIMDTHTINSLIPIYKKKEKEINIIVNTASYIKFMEYIKKITTKKSKLYNKIKKVRKKYFSFESKDKEKIKNFININKI